MEKVRFRDLSYPLKIPIIFAWFFGILYTLIFTVEFIAMLLLDYGI